MTLQNPTKEGTMADEKFDEKEREKSEEKAPEEKWRRDPLGSIIWAAILIWAGVVLLANNLGYLDSLKRLTTGGPEWMLGWESVWGLILLGAGGILLVEVLTRLLVPAYRRPIGGTLILAFVFIGLGLGNIVSWNLIWPLILIAIGLSIVFGGRLQGQDQVADAIARQDGRRDNQAALFSGAHLVQQLDPPAGLHFEEKQ